MTFNERKLAWEATEHARRFLLDKDGNTIFASLVAHEREGKILKAAEATRDGVYFNMTGMDDNALAEVRALAQEV